MKDSNKAIAARINKELKNRGWKQSDLLKKILEFKNPNLSKEELYKEVLRKKGNFSTTLKGTSARTIPKEELYIISKIFSLPLEYIWFGDDKKSEFKPNGARYAAYKDNENDYRAYIAGLEYEDKLQCSDEFGFTLFDYLGQYSSINGYKFFEKNYNLNFDYVRYIGLSYTNGDGYSQLCSLSEEKNTILDSMLMTLIEYKDVRTFKKIFFENCSLDRFDSNQYCRQDKKIFSDDFLDALLNDELFLKSIFKVEEIDISNFNRNHQKGEKRNFVEPLFYETLFYAIKNEERYKKQLRKMLEFALNFNKTQFDFVNEYLNSHENEYSDVCIDRYNPNFLVTSRYIPMGNIFRIGDRGSDEEINALLNEIEKYAFNITHIINGQEKSNEAIKISTPDNPLFLELCKNAVNQNATFVPLMINYTKEFTYFRNFDSRKIAYNDCSEMKSIIECLDKAQKLVDAKSNKVLVHGNLNEKVLMVEKSGTIGLSGWENCRYGSKFDDRVDLLMEVEQFYSSYNKPLQSLISIFDVIAQGFSNEDKIKLLDKTISALNEKIQKLLSGNDEDLLKAYKLNERLSKLELLKKLLIRK